MVEPQRGVGVKLPEPLKKNLLKERMDEKRYETLRSRGGRLPGP